MENIVMRNGEREERKHFRSRSTVLLGDRFFCEGMDMTRRDRRALWKLWDRIKQIKGEPLTVSTLWMPGGYGFSF